MTETQTLEFSEIIAATPEQVYRAFSTSVALESWFADFAEVDLREKGRFYCWWNVGYYASGLFTKVLENEQVAFTWNGLHEPHDTQIDIFIQAHDDGTEVKIRHSEVGTSSEWAERVAAYEKGWQTGLTNLKSVMETGLDKRVYDRPMLGILLGNLVDATKAAELSLPVDYGENLSGVIEGMGAEAAGLQKGDILVSLNGQKIKTYQDFATALANCKAGDFVEVIFYRGSERNIAQMELSRRAVPEAPESAVAFAEKIAATYTEVSAERDALFDDIVDAQAAARPAPEEWSAKETLVHLLYTERWLHLAISCAVSGQRTGGFANQLELIAAMADSYPLTELLAELKRSEQVTIASLKALPAAFVADKRQFLGLVNSLGWVSDHTRSHFDQIKAALDAAK